MSQPPDPTSRFSDRVANYVKYRPGYPREIVPEREMAIGLSPGNIVADIGSGTGFSARLFLENGNRVLGVEPNEPMRLAAEELLAEYSRFESVPGTAEATGLGDSSADLVVAAQAFHWFDRDAVRREWERILRPEGWVVLLWNERRLDATPFLRAYEKLQNLVTRGLVEKIGKEYKGTARVHEASSAYAAAQEAAAQEQA